ncbi:hypothetical protein ACFLU1_03515 [Chloroflexota bacterium]
MKRLVYPVITMLILGVLVAAGCAGEESVLTQGEEVLEVSSCVNCHSNKTQLKEVAAMPGEIKSEATSGEG